MPVGRAWQGGWAWLAAQAEIRVYDNGAPGIEEVHSGDRRDVLVYFAFFSL